MTPLQAALRILASHGRHTLLDKHYAAGLGVVRRRGSLDRPVVLRPGDQTPDRAAVGKTVA